METSSSGSRRPACDNCKDRKTKCDRSFPCSSCIVASLDCHVSKRSSEKKQRILISSRYDEAMESVGRSLQDISASLKLLQVGDTPPRHAGQSNTLATFISDSPSSLPVIDEGYRGESSFKAHVQKVMDALREAASNLEMSTMPVFSETIAATQAIQESANSDENASTVGHSQLAHPKRIQYPELADRSLPPLEHVLNLCRLAKREKQQFFSDTPFLGEEEFATLCQQVYFAINDYSILTWAIVNTGLYHLLVGLDPEHYEHIGVKVDEVQSYLRLLAGNLEIAISSLRICQEPCFLAAEALTLLSTYCNKAGRSSVAWTLISAASRMCVDLGWHRLTRVDTPALVKNRLLFWHIYIHDSSMSFTLGRTPTIHQDDISTSPPNISEEYPGPLGRIYSGYFDFTLIVREMHSQLFSAAALRATQAGRIEKAKALAVKLTQVSSKLRQTLESDPVTEATHKAANVLFDIITHSLVAVAYRVVPCDEPGASPLQCHFGCVQASRHALSTIIQMHESFGRLRPARWVIFLNMLFSLVPFAPFIVLAGNTIATSSTEDLKLLSTTISAIQPMADGSPSGKKLLDVCTAFYEFANFSVARQAALTSVEAWQHSVSTSDAPGDSGLCLQLTDLAPASYDYNMAPQDWDTVMNGFELGTGAGAMASFIEPYIPFDGRPL